ncbi:hypothetical protein MUP07_00780 [Candidatus Bathyarchaeota archaeon]|nr:hypothetical protein [Candidatus Bathyarchaeota archaeon]
MAHLKKHGLPIVLLLLLTVLAVPFGLCQVPVQPNQTLTRVTYNDSYLALQFPRGDLIVGRANNIRRDQRSPYSLTERLSIEMYGIYWASNSTDTWIMDFYVNYSVPVKFMVNYALYGSDSQGNVLGTRGEDFLVEGQVIWIHVVMTTVAAPHFPTLSEAWGFIFGRDTPLMQGIGSITQNQGDLIQGIYLVFGILAVNLLVTIFLLAAVVILLAKGRR